MQAFVELLDVLQILVESQTPPAEILEAVLDQTGYLAELRTSLDPQDETRIENLAELEAVAREFEETAANNDEPATLFEFLERVSLVADADSIPNGDDGGGVVTLMTLHTAKGLEFPVVFLTAMEDGVFPHIRSLDDPAELQEERRLAYVGLTRARQRLYLSRAVSRSTWGAPNYNLASRFLEEIPTDLLDWRREAEVAHSDRWKAVPSRTPSVFAPAARRSSGQPVLDLAPGDRVTHDSFGLGTVVAISGEGDRAQATVDFGSTGEKRLLLRYAPVQKL
jgi:DNA helicase-2/ATP-dependent DNA helicase PcrA